VPADISPIGVRETSPDWTDCQSVATGKLSKFSTSLSLASRSGSTTTLLPARLLARSPSSHLRNPGYRRQTKKRKQQTGKGRSPSCQRREEDEARHLQKSNTALQQQREELQPEFIIPSENKGTDLEGKLTHRLHPSHLPLQAGNKFSK